MPSSLPNPVPLSAQSIPFWEFLENGTVPKEYLESDYITEQFVERLVHYVLTVPSKTFSMIQLSNLLEQIDPRHQVFFSNRYGMLLGERAAALGRATGVPKLPCRPPRRRVKPDTKSGATPRSGLM